MKIFKILELEEVTCMLLIKQEVEGGTHENPSVKGRFDDPESGNL